MTILSLNFCHPPRGDWFTTRYGGFSQDKAHNAPPAGDEHYELQIMKHGAVRYLYAFAEPGHARAANPGPLSGQSAAVHSEG